MTSENATKAYLITHTTTIVDCFFIELIILLLLTNNKVITSKAGEIPKGNTYPADGEGPLWPTPAGAKQG